MKLLIIDIIKGLIYKNNLIQLKYYSKDAFKIK
jgi:hypothetical protein